MLYSFIADNFYHYGSNGWENFDKKIIDAVASVPKDDFLPTSLKGKSSNSAYFYRHIALSAKNLLRVLASLAILPTDHVLEVGTDAGYITAVLAKLGAKVDTISNKKREIKAAQQLWSQLGLMNIQASCRDITTPEDLCAFEERYNIIVLNGSLPGRSPGLEKKLAIGGRMFITVGEAPAMAAQLVTRVGERQFWMENLFETKMKRLFQLEFEEEYLL